MMKPETGLRASIMRQLRRMGSRRMYLFALLVPVLMALFFINLMREGLPLHVPTAVVDLDHSAMSRNVIRSLGATELVTIDRELESYDSALGAVRRGEVFGFFVIPPKFEEDALGGRETTIEYFTNLTYFIPGSLAFKGFKTVSVTTAGSVVRTELQALGADGGMVMGLLQPVNVQQHLLGNPWMNYSYYLSPSFIMCTLALMIVLITIFSITQEIKEGTSRQWLATAGGRIGVAVTGKLLPMTVAYTAMAMLILWLMIGYAHFPMHGSLCWIAVATVLLVVASQALGLIICCLLPNPRLAYSVGGLVSILAYSLAGFSYPVQSMYGALAIFNYILPIRHYFLIYVNQALNGFDIYYVRWHLAALVVFPLVGALGLRRLKRAAENPVYVR